jgi:signal transduction histidine kinase
VDKEKIDTALFFDKNNLKRVKTLQQIKQQQTIEELVVSNKNLLQLNLEKDQLVEKSVITISDLMFQNEKMELRLSELLNANDVLAFENEKKAEELSELIIAYEKLNLQNEKKGLQLSELIIAYEGLTFENELKDKRAEDQILVNRNVLNAEKNTHRQKEEHNIKINEVLEFRILERTAQLEAANSELEAFSYSVSHDLRAPLRAISGHALILKEDYAQVLDKAGNDSIDVLIESSKKMGQLIDDLLKFSQLGRLEAVKSDVDMNSIVEQVIKEFALIRDIRKYHLTTGKLPRCKGDENMLKQVWFNLIDNALKYAGTKESPVIAIGCKIEKNILIYFIKDNGVGFDMAYEDKLFGVFQRLHSADEFEGTGLGLSLVKRIVEKHKGRVFAESILNEGSTFYFTIPK